MNLNEFEELFRSVCEAYEQRDLSFSYDRAWYLDGAPSATYPHLILERQPSLRYIKGLKNNFLPQVAEFNFKVFFFDEYNFDEQGAKSYSLKQTELLNISNQIFAELTRIDREKGHGFNFKFEGNFFGDIKNNNNALMELSCNCTAELKVSCALGTFDYER